jgi:CheY-like chemotaxis protein
VAQSEIVTLGRRDLDDNRLFSPYCQTALGRHQGGKGSGLGLALVRESINISDGRLGVRSQAGKGAWRSVSRRIAGKRAGATFWLELVLSLPQTPVAKSLLRTAPSLPANRLNRNSLRPSSAPSPRAPPFHSTPLASKATSVGLRVLVVDDDKLTRAIMLKMLTKAGHDVQTAESGQIGLQTALAQSKAGSPFHVIFIDNQVGPGRFAQCGTKAQQMPTEDGSQPIFGVDAIQRCAFLLFGRREADGTGKDAPRRYRRVHLRLLGGR